MHLSTILIGILVVLAPVIVVASPLASSDLAVSSVEKRQLDILGVEAICVGSCLNEFEAISGGRITPVIQKADGTVIKKEELRAVLEQKVKGVTLIV